MSDLDSGEHDAILLVLHLKADLVLMDERDGVDEARRMGLTALESRRPSALVPGHVLLQPLH